MTIAETKAAIAAISFDDAIGSCIQVRSVSDDGWKREASYAINVCVLKQLCADHSRLEEELENVQAIVGMFRNACHWEEQTLLAKLAVVREVAALAENGGPVASEE